MLPLSAKLKSGIKTGWDLIPIALRLWWDDDPFRLASSLAFYTVFSLAPILLITVGLASIIFSEQEAKRLVIEQIALMTGSEGAQVARQVLNNLGDIGRNAKAVFIGLTAALIGSTAVFVNLQSALNHIWRVKAAPGSRMWRAFIRDRLRSFGIVLAVGFLLLVSMGFSALISGLQEILVQSTSAVPWIWQFSNTTISFTITAVLFAMIYKYLPDVRIGWGDVLIGATITAGLFSAGKFLIGLYLGRTAIGSSYGAAGSFVVLLVWIYYSALICFLGAEFTQVYARRYGTRIRPETHAVRLKSVEQTGASGHGQKCFCGPVDKESS